MMLAVRWLLGALGVAGVAHGVLLLLDRPREQIVDATTWLVSGVVLHDLVLAPATVLVVVAGARLLPDAWRAPAAASLVVLGSVTLWAIPVLGRFGARPDNQTLLDRPYVAGWLLIVGTTLIAAAATALVHRGRRDPGDEANAAPAFPSAQGADARILVAMDVDVLVEAVIPYPRDVVASFAGDPKNAPEWYANIVSAQWRTPPPMSVGSTMDFEARFLGRRLSYTYEVVELEPGERLVMRTADGPFPMETTYVWESVPGGTLMRLRNRGTPSGFAKVTRPVMAKAMKAAMTKDLQRLADRLGRP